MAVNLSLTGVNANTLAVTLTSLAITTESLITMYVVNKTGTHANSHVGLECTPNGTDWSEELGLIRAKGGHMTYQVNATKIRPFIEEAEGAASTVDIHIIAR